MDTENTPKKKGSRKKVALIGAGLFVLLMIVGAACGAKTETAASHTTTAPVVTVAPVTDAPTTAAPVVTAAPTTQAPTTTVPPAPVETSGQTQAVLSANGYLDMGTGFSRAGLINQLSSSSGEDSRSRTRPTPLTLSTSTGTHRQSCRPRGT
jgi:hypothetical protein